MTERELFEAIGHVDDDLILAADAPVKKTPPGGASALAAGRVRGRVRLYLFGRRSRVAERRTAQEQHTQRSRHGRRRPGGRCRDPPAPNMPMLDAAAPQAADADEGAAVERTAPLPASLWAWRSAYRSTACCILIRAARWTAPRTAGLTGSLRQALTGTPSRRRTGARTLVPGIPTG